MPLYLQDEGIVLRKRPLKEKDEIVILLTKHHGKRTFVVPGSRDPRSKKAGVLELCNTIRFQVRESKGRLPYLNQVQLIQSRGFGIVEGDDSLGQFYRALQMLKLVDQLVQEEQNAPFIYDQLSIALDAVSDPLSLLWLWIRGLDEGGVLPDLKTCVFCQRRPDSTDDVWFCREHRGFSHRTCLSVSPVVSHHGSSSPHDPHGKSSFVAVDFSIIKLASYLQQHDWDEVKKVKAPKEMMEGMLRLLESVPF